MREIEFRGKRIDNGEWICGGCFQAFRDRRTKEITKTLIAESESPILDALINAGDGNWIEYQSAIWNLVDPETVGQYTGLKDKHGKKIYEGDIVDTLWGIYEVIFDGYRFKLKGFLVACFDYPDDGFSECIDQIEVIGNIHDNKELLEGQNV